MKRIVRNWMTISKNRLKGKVILDGRYKID